MRPIYLKATNFLSFEKLEYSFENKPFLIQGENLVDDGQKSNGSGKSGFNQSLTFALFGDSGRKALTKNLIKWGEKSSNVELHIECPRRKTVLAILRTIKKSGTTLELIEYKLNDSIKNGELVSFSSISDGNNKIIKWIGVSKDDLKNYFILNGEKYTSFFQSSNTDKIDLISRISDAKIIEGTDKLVLEDININKSELRLLEDKSINFSAKIENFKELLEEEKSRDLEEEKSEAIKSIDDNINRCKENIKKQKEQIICADKRISNLKDDFVRANIQIEESSKKFNKFKDTIKDFNKERKTFDDKIISNNAETKEMKDLRLQFNKELSDITNKLAGTITCPKCGHRFILDDDIDIEKEELHQEELKSGLETIKISLDGLLYVAKEIDKSISKINTEERASSKEYRMFQSVIDDLDSNIKDIERSKTTEEKNRKEIEHSIDRQNVIIKNLKNDKKLLSLKNNSNDDKIKEFEDKIAEQEDLLKINKKSISKKETKIAKLVEWVYNFKKFYSELANKSLKIVEGYCNKHLRQLGSDMEVQLEGYKVKSDGTLSEKITPYVIRGGEVLDWGSFSKGERGRLDYAGIFAIQDIINSTNTNGAFNMLMADEVDAGLDSLGLGLLLKSLAKVEKPILITTHITDDLGVDSILVRKELNGSKLIINN